MATYLFDQNSAKNELKIFFQKQKADINSFGSTVNQTFEAAVFAKVIKWYQNNHWAVNIVNPSIKGKQVFRLKFNTRGAPAGYSFVRCTKGSKSCQIRHGLRVHTKYHRQTNRYSANVVCDIVIMNDIDIHHYLSDDSLPNEELISFGEVKHMSAFAELLANFIGLTHELKPECLKRIRVHNWKMSDKISCFLYVSGLLYTTAKGIAETIRDRKFDIDIYSHDNQMNHS